MDGDIERHRLNPEKARLFVEDWKSRHPSEFRAAMRRWRENHPEKVAGYRSARKERNAEGIRRYKREWDRKRLATPEGRLIHNLRSGLNHALGSKRKNRTLQLVGCSLEFLVARFTEMMTGTEMTWENMGSFWEIDHILPVSHFDHSDPKQVATCWNYANLQPLPTIENRRKSNKVLEMVHATL